MSKIAKMQIKNFKFFMDSTPIVLEGKHLLLYGENGSGKSSIYYALYTLLQAASKQEHDAQKYFDVNDTQTLVNIYADCTQGSDNTGSYISLEDTNGKSYKLSYSQTACIADPNLLESNRASDFLNYVSLFRFQMFRNSETADLHDLFRYTIIPSLSFPTFEFQGKNLKGAEDMYLAYKKGPGTTINPQGKQILVYSNSPEYRNFQDLEAHFNECMQDLINFINANVNNKIKEFDYDFKIELAYKPASHKKKDTWIEYVQPFGITFRIVEYNGKVVVVEHPSTFLNEAKMTALAFCIRWAILDYRLQAGVVPEALKVLVLDDVMISLDMANRNKLVRIILSKLAKEFQILFLTHDMQLFDCMKSELMSLYNKKEDELKDTDWTLYEMYDAGYGGQHYPILLQPLTSYQKAHKYFYGKNCTIDYTASGNAMRQALESAFKELFRKANIIHNQNGDAIEKEKLMIADCINLARTFQSRLGISTNIINKIESLRGCFLNAASHHNPGRNYYRQEILEAFEVYECLTRYDSKIIVPKKESVNFTITATDRTVHSYTVVLKQDLMASRLLDVNKHTVYWAEGDYDVCDSADPDKSPFHPHHITLQQVFIDCFQYLSKGDENMRGRFPDALDVIKYNGQSLRELLELLQ